MINHVGVNNFPAVPYLRASLLMQAHPDGVHFSTEKPNVIVGPNGAGKSALLTALTLKTLCYFRNQSALDNNYVIGNNCDVFWTKERSWRQDFEYLPGLTCDSDNGPALYYRPGHIPGNDDSITASMMCGYFEEAKAYGKMVDKKSSGQQSQAVLQRMQAGLAGEDLKLKHQYANWRFGKEVKDLNKGRGYVCDFEYRAEVLKKLYGSVPADAIPLLMMDEPEQSLDAKAEALLWRQIAGADCIRMQVIVATHSLYPMMHPEAFHLIEAVPGYIKEVQSLI
jgi:hypothetical protein